MASMYALPWNDKNFVRPTEDETKEIVYIEVL